MRKFKVIAEYPNSPYKKGTVVEFQDDEFLGAAERETLYMMEKFPRYFQEELDSEYYVKLLKGYAVSVGQSNEYAGTSDSVESFEDEDEALMFYAKNTRLFSFEDINKLPLEASHLEFFMQTIKKLVNENKSRDQENS